ncbi:MAG: hypothetical protein AB1523_03680 [Bacillota bacterium]
MVDIAVYCEGHTEWFVVYKLQKIGVLSSAYLLGSKEYEERKYIDKTWIKNSIKDLFKEPGILINPSYTNILLIYDQEKKPKANDIPQEITKKAQKKGLSLTFETDNFSNVFYAKVNGSNISLFVSDKPGPDGNRDFDGYIVELLECAGPEIIANLLSDKDIMTISSLRKKVQHLPAKEETVYLLGREDIPGLMSQRDWGVQRSKTLLYSIITAAQINKSHVLFSGDVVEKAPAEKLKQVFAPLIAAWDALVAMAAMDA